jgi:hypothetical protein
MRWFVRWRRSAAPSGELESETGLISSHWTSHCNVISDFVGILGTFTDKKKALER